MAYESKQKSLPPKNQRSTQKKQLEISHQELDSNDIPNQLIETPQEPIEIQPTILYLPEEKLFNDLLLTEPESLVKKLFLPNDLEYQTLN